MTTGPDNAAIPSQNVVSRLATGVGPKDEILIQDGIASDLAQSGSKVLYWKNGVHGRLRQSVVPSTGQIKQRSLVVMEDYYNPKTGETIMGLVSAIELVNRTTFQAWLDQNPTAALAGTTVRTLAQAAANHLADLYENPQSLIPISFTPRRLGTWRLLLALGEAQAWRTLCQKWGLSFDDPRVLPTSLIPGAPKGSQPIPYKPCFEARNTLGAFLHPSLRPAWLTDKSGARFSQKQANDTSLVAQSWLDRQLLPCPTKTDADRYIWSGNQNRLTWIREYQIDFGGGYEKPDFLLLIHGLPLVFVEVKVPGAGNDEGLTAAIADFQNKPTYQGAPICVATDGEQVIVSSCMEGELSKWVHYPDNITDDINFAAEETDDVTVSSDYFFRQLMAKPARVEFFLRYCGSLDKSGYYQVSRSQQYQALAKLKRDLEWLEAANEVQKKEGRPALNLGNRLIRHTQRTGKTHTMIRAIHLAQGAHPSLFNMSLLMVGEVPILGQIFAELDPKSPGDTGLSDQALSIVQAESRESLRQLLDGQRNPASAKQNLVVLANMQKLEAVSKKRASDGVEVGKPHQALPDSQKVLVVLDEGHLAQTGDTAHARSLILPEASHLLMTATPKDSMSQYYGINKSWHILDDFGFGVARRAQMVCPVVFRRYTYSFLDDPNRIAALTSALLPSLKTSLLSLDEKELSESIEKALAGQFDEDSINNSAASQVGRQVIRQVRRQLEIELIQERLDAIVEELERYEHSLPRVDGKPVEDFFVGTQRRAERIFRPRALVFGGDTRLVKEIIKFIQQRNLQQDPDTPSDQLNFYKGWRFAVDVSNFGKDLEGSQDNETDQDENTLSSHRIQRLNRLKGAAFTKLNPGVAYDPKQTDLKERLKSKDPGRRIDVLLAVGKYTKGYNNEQLALVALLRSVAEPSLMNQIYTRPATQLQGKPNGVLLDLSFGLNNIQCWRRSLEMYDKKVDLDQFYTQEQAADHAKLVRAKLSGAAKSLNLGIADLADTQKVLDQFELIGDMGREVCGRQFIINARDTATLISQMPDISLYMDIRLPLAGLRESLWHIQSLYPKLMEEPRQEDGRSDVKHAGYSPQTLGMYVRSALNALACSSLQGIWGSDQTPTLKGLLGLGLDNQFHDITPTDEGSSPELTRAREARQLRQIQRVIEAMLARDTVPGNNPDSHSGREMRAVSAITDSLNRTLDKIRDDLHQSDSVKGVQTHASARQRIIEVLKDIGNFRQTHEDDGGALRALIEEGLFQLVYARANQGGLNYGFEEEANYARLSDILRVASQDIAQVYRCWQKQNPSSDEPAARASEMALFRISDRKLTKYISPASKRKDLHGLEEGEWMGQIKSHALWWRKILGEDLPIPHGDAETVIVRALGRAIEQDQYQTQLLHMGSSLVK